MLLSNPLAQRCEREIRGARNKEQYKAACRYTLLASKQLYFHERYALRSLMWSEGLRYTTDPIISSFTVVGKIKPRIARTG